MVFGPEFGSFQPAYLAVLREIATRHRFDTCGRGKDALEIINTSFTVTDPVDRIVYLAARKANVVFNHAEALWYLTGRDDVDMISYYAPQLRNLSADGARLTGTAYGPRLFRPGQPDAHSQFQRVERLLGDDPDTKRAAMVIMRPDELVDPANPDVACTLGLQFLLRNGQLHMSAYMRGNDAVIGLLGDTFAFTFIQEFTARRLGVGIGRYAHHVGSMHINKLDVDKVDAMLAEATGPLPNRRFPVDQMPATSWETIREVAAWEQVLRDDRDQLTPGRLTTVRVDPYWRRVLALFEFYRQIVHNPGKPVGRDILAELHPGHWWLVANRWPERVPAFPGSRA
ncbi:thymidylate synthase [Micromonospora sp. A200]|uniref:thymidylate synthase n=1 Tax=Micromonospora sp. A200 TaxID=2940568 RepID=UPI00247660AC|nr:thymidylate synthase [Micromonospora sp. A200]MDH6465763.1 thymidylate synthase [Micromonospora sp. A200]